MFKWIKKLFKKNYKGKRLNISDDPRLNKIHKAPDLTHLYANDLMIYYKMLTLKNSGRGVTISEFQTLIVYYTIDLFIEYHDKAFGVLPNSIIIGVKDNVLSAAQINFAVFREQDKIDFYHYMVDNFLENENIVEHTKTYMENLESSDMSA